MENDFDINIDVIQDIPEDEPEVTDEVDIPDNIPEDTSENESEMPTVDDLPEDIPEDELEVIEEVDIPDSIPEDISENETEMPTVDDLPEDIPEDDLNEEKELSEESQVDDTDWERTSLRREEELLLNEMEENGEIEADEVNSEWVEPEHTELHLPTEKTGEFDGEPGNSAFKPSSESALERMKGFGKESVEYKDGYPVFDPFTAHDSEWGTINGQVEIGHMTDNRTNPAWEMGRRPQGKGHDPNYDLGNFSQADNAVAEQLKDDNPSITGEDIEKYRKQNKLIWHECADGKTMQLVPKEIHEACRHSGGVSEMKFRMAYGDINMPNE